MKRLTIWHTNDVHSHLEHWPRISSFLKAEKRAAREKAENVLFFDIGDFLDRVHPFTEGTAGKANVELLNELPYDAVTFGNNEGTTLSHEQLNELYGAADFPVVCANFYADVERTKRAEWALPVVYKRVGDAKVAVLGATAAFSDYYESLGWGIEEPIKALRRELAKLDPDTDLVILLSHLGLPLDEEIAIQLPEIDVILGGHTHHLLEEGKKIGSTLLAACGRWGEYVGRVEIAWNDEGKFSSKSARVYKTDSLAAPADEAEQISAFFEKGKKELSNTIVTLPAKLSHNWFDDSAIADIMHEARWNGQMQTVS
ncbi:Ser/Thr protein phosphatase [Listeria floridensis FSL S10-1187]|uniref:Ser/Thr protein phosphatase n=1 Tax=Listeria floridensis FSL S10-1187 TaxID=1265817 RepID=A0ABP3AYV1_9LIST|nr:Ser/Thr protein phosphatase [Listeria floridensis FSL S10-1187]